MTAIGGESSMSRKLLSVAAALVALPFASTVSVAAPPVYSWTGCYIGGNLGGGWAPTENFDITFEAGNPVGKTTAKGFLGGVQGGCDIQFAGNWLVGVQGMYDWARLKGDNAYTPDHDYTDFTKVDSVATLTGRIGWAFQPVNLIYVKGGVAWVGNEPSEKRHSDPGYFNHANYTATGWTVGGGWEFQFASNWSLFLEYNFIDTGTEKVHFTGSDKYFYNVRQDVHQVIVGLNWRFNASPPPP
jgi:outer membrane immunogenic protein